MGISFISNDVIQSALVAYIKTKSNITSLLASTSEVREDQYQGTEFNYPNLRIRTIENTPIGNPGCGQNISVGFMVFSENASSLQAEQIAGIIAKVFHGRQFTSNGIAFAITVANAIPAVRSNVRTWRSEVLCKGIANG